MSETFRPSIRAKALSTLAVEAAKPDPHAQYEIRDGKIPGLALRVSPAGTKSWGVRYRTRNGHQRRLTLGRFPSVGLAKAREMALRAIGDVAAGEDPARAKRTARAALAGNPATVGELIEIFLEMAKSGRHKPNGRPQRASTLALERYSVDRLIKPKLGDLPLAELGRIQLQTFLDDIHTASPAGARLCHAVIRQAYNFGIRRDLTTLRNPAQLVDLPAALTRDRVFSDHELRAMWNATSAPTISGLAIRLAIVTLQRGGEVAGIHARELDRSARLWTLPAERTKNHRSHVVPLSPLAIDLLDQAFAFGSTTGEWKGFAFPCPHKTERETKPIRRSTLSHAAANAATLAGIADATAHDFRRTGATNMTGERIGIPRFIVSRVLNQMSDTGGAAAVTSVYDRNEYLSEKRRALDAWAELLHEIVNGEKAGQQCRQLRALVVPVPSEDVEDLGSKTDPQSLISR